MSAYAAALASLFAETSSTLAAAGGELAEAVDGARDQGLEARASDLAGTTTVLEAGEQQGEALEPVVEGLEIVLRVVDQIEQLLSALG